MIPKFRAWDKTTSKLHVVNGIYCDNKKIHYIDDNRVRFVDFDNVIIMQSTGLLTEMARRFLRGDILAVGTDEEVVNVNVLWDEKHALFIFESKKYNEKDLLAKLVEDNAYPFEIVGNIYENKGLLEVSD
jgi:uncharacterized phage protein (TIGR01671 family)